MASHSCNWDMVSSRRHGESVKQFEGGRRVLVLDRHAVTGREVEPLMVKESLVRRANAFTSKFFSIGAIQTELHGDSCFELDSDPKS